MGSKLGFQDTICCVVSKKKTMMGDLYKLMLCAVRRVSRARTQTCVLTVSRLHMRIVVEGKCSFSLRVLTYLSPIGIYQFASDKWRESTRNG